METHDKIWISGPKIGMTETQNVIEVLKSGMLAYGAKTKAFETEFAKYMGVKHAIACNSGTSALFLAYKSLGIGPGDEVITTPFTFAATVDMIKAVGATPVFVDIKDDFNINEELIEDAITNKTKAIVPVHLFGKPCHMKAIMRIARKHKLKVVEDAAQAIGSSIGKRKCGSFGNVSIFSFYPTKIITTGEGGMCVTNDDKLAEEIRLLRNHGMHGLNYDYSMVGYNFNMSDVAGAIGLAQLEKLDSFISVRRAIAHDYNSHLIIEGKPHDEIGTQHVFNNYTFLIKDRDNFVRQMDANGINCRVYYPEPLFDLPNATRVSKSIVSIPIRPNLTSSDIWHIIEMINSYIEGEH